MTKLIETFSGLIAPFDEAAFFSQVHDRKFLHIPADDPAKLDSIMTWAVLTDILNMTAFWNTDNFKLYLDTKPVPPQQYCRPAPSLSRRQVLQPDAARVNDWLAKGASIVANDIDTLTPGLVAAANAVERRLGGKLQSNLYCSRKGHQAFPVHFDTHEVFALHVEGEKVWRIYEGRLPNPIANPQFRNLPPEYHAKNKGKLAAEITLKPGDVLYIPRGQYHEAVASSDGCVHLSFGVTHIIGMDILSLLYERAMVEPEFRANMPGPDASDRDIEKWLKGLGAALPRLLGEKQVVDRVKEMRRQHFYPRAGFDLGGD